MSDNSPQRQLLVPDDLPPVLPNVKRSTYWSLTVRELVARKRAVFVFLFIFAKIYII